MDARRWQIARTMRRRARAPPRNRQFFPAPHVCCRVRARLTDHVSLSCNDQVLPAAAEEQEQQQQEEEEEAVVSLSGCALLCARCCVVTSHPARAQARHFHSPFIVRSICAYLVVLFLCLGPCTASVLPLM